MGHSKKKISSKTKKVDCRDTLMATAADTLSREEAAVARARAHANASADAPAY
ncbi:hypothetical protein A2U01_0056927, partial [Trifolium medium]|nr:hypothetical protein [Trifolium medium]